MAKRIVAMRAKQAATIRSTALTGHFESSSYSLRRVSTVKGLLIPAIVIETRVDILEVGAETSYVRVKDEIKNINLVSRIKFSNNKESILISSHKSQSKASLHHSQHLVVETRTHTYPSSSSSCAPPSTIHHGPFMHITVATPASAYARAIFSGYRSAAPNQHTAVCQGLTGYTRNRLRYLQELLILVVGQQVLSHQTFTFVVQAFTDHGSATVIERNRGLRMKREDAPWNRDGH